MDENLWDDRSMVFRIIAGKDIHSIYKVLQIYHFLTELRKSSVGRRKAISSRWVLPVLYIR